MPDYAEDLPNPATALTRPTGTHYRAWVSFMHAQAKILQRLADDLDSAGEIPLGTYDVLVQLSEAGGRLRLKDLLQKVLLSQPGLSRKVERLAAAGLVGRAPDPHDGRGVLVTLTPAGRAALRSAATVHLNGIARDFTSHFDEDEAQLLDRIFQRVVTAIDDPDAAAGTPHSSPTGS